MNHRRCRRRRRHHQRRQCRQSHQVCHAKQYEIENTPFGAKWQSKSQKTLFVNTHLNHVPLCVFFKCFHYFRFIALRFSLFSEIECRMLIIIKNQQGKNEKNSCVPLFGFRRFRLFSFLYPSVRMKLIVNEAIDKQRKKNKYLLLKPESMFQLI